LALSLPLDASAELSFVGFLTFVAALIMPSTVGRHAPRGT
jgi:hypothetical protein